MRKSVFTLMIALLVSVMSFAQLTGSKSIPGDYATVAEAIVALNTNGVGPGGVTFNVAGGHTETFANATTGIITATGTASNPIVFQRNGGVSNPVITAGVGTTTTIDGIIVLAGGDYITFDGIDLTESATNADQTTRMEFGYALVKANNVAPVNGCQYVTIKNSSITLNKYLTPTTFTTCNGIYSGNHTATLLPAIPLNDVSDAMKNCKFFNNTITNVTNGIRLNGWHAASPPYDLFDQNNEIGVDGANTITNFTTYGINVRYQKTLKIANNITTTNTLPSAQLYGIFVQNTVGVDTYNNTVTLQPSGGNQALNGINVTVGESGYSGSIYNNTVQNCTNVAATSAAFSGITVSGTPTSVNVHDNIVTNNQIPGTGNFSGIDGGGSTGILNIYNNIVSYNTKSGATGTFVGMRVSGLTDNNAYNNQIFSNYNTTTATTTGGGITGITVNNSGTTTGKIHSNKVYDLSANGTNGVVNGITVQGPISMNVYNNFISDLRAPNATSTTKVNAIAGINIVSGGLSANVFYNTVYLNASSTGANLYSSALLANVNPVLDMRNNILVNVSVPGGGVTTAFRRSAVAAGLPTYSVNSNANVFYAGAIENTNNTIYYDGTNTYAFANYQTLVGPARDAGSFRELPPFVNVAAMPYDLHINTGIATSCESGGLMITSPFAITNDYDSNVRGTAPDIGADEFAGIALGVINPGGVAATPVSSHQINLTFVTNPSDNDVLIVWNNSGAFATPADTPPAIGEPFAGGTVLYYGKTSPVNHAGLNGATSYYYKAYSFDGLNYSFGVTVSGSTNIAAPTAFTAVSTSPTQITLNYTKNPYNNDVIIATNFWDNFGQPVNGTVYTAGNNLPTDGTVIYVGPLSTFTHMGLSPNLTAYYYKIWSFDPTNNNIYSPSGATANAQTQCSSNSIPYLESFEYNGAVGCGVVIDANSNFNTWYAATNFPRPGGVFTLRINGGFGAEANDWYITNGLELTAGVKYEVKFWYRTSNLLGSTHQLEVKWGNAQNVAGMTSAPIYYNSNLPNATVYSQITCALFTPPTSGIYHVGWHDFSAIAPGPYLVMDDITINGFVPPTPPTALTATPEASVIHLDYDLNAAGNNVIIATNSVPIFDQPVDQQTYQAGNVIGSNGTVLYVGPLSDFDHVGLLPLTTYYYKIWSVDAKTLYSADGVTADATTGMFQSICLPLGWSGISTFMIPESNDVSNVLEDISGNMQIILSTYGFYWPSQNINTFGDWNTYKGYKIKMNSQTCFDITGNEVENRTINVPAGVSYIPVLCDQPVLASSILSQLGSGFMYAFDIYSGLVYWPAGQIYTLNYLEPGKGYLINLTQPGQATFGCTPTDLTNFVSAQPAFYEYAPWICNKSGEQHLISFTPSSLAGLEKGDFIGVFNASGECAGITQYNGSNENLLLIAYDDDFTTPSNDGLTEGESMSFRIYKSSKGIEIPVEAEFSSTLPNSGIFTEMGQSMIVKMTESTTSVGDIQLHDIQIYPNPGNGLFTIQIPTVNQTVSVVVKNSTGQAVYAENIDGKINSVHRVDLSHINAGVYFVTISCNNEILVKKLIVR